MARQPTFRQANLVRAVKAARDAGLSVVASEIRADGTIRLEHETTAGKNSPDPFDSWKAARDAR